eukprot:CAMPEP_0194146388 /NCGR_PEP_ID=MMETSP0152-20130528/20562_1 /TAXON_ID=1049557 /ORGANISM="Thalassiothrix antarctica, Strain L6-D1" /LENGTH=291 /DNA_ID=CAMNT_0038846897 /DNA_START=56 /DNA_END=932 /DNA_ORIENTATION=+
MKAIRIPILVTTATGALAFSTRNVGLSRPNSSVTGSFFQKKHAFSLPNKRLIPRNDRGGGVNSLNMIFGNLFGSGGMFDTKKSIDYTALDHPGPELATAAEEGKVLIESSKDPSLRLATFAGGCFWGFELAYQRVPGVVHTATGYTQGDEAEPTYQEVCAEGTGHTEAIMVYYDPKECTYESLLDTFFERVDPTTINGQGRDYGKHYRTGVYVHTAEQLAVAKPRFEQEQTKLGCKIASELKKTKPFWPAEKYHQQYLEKGGRLGEPQSAEKGSTDTIDAMVEESNEMFYI